ncbi:MAG: fatty acyl-AMP ligase [bacterium]|nr:fatty acyl-AMP ligase [bacterium]
MLNACESIVEPFIEKTLENPDRNAIILISDDDSEEKISCGQLHSNAISLSQTLQSNGIKKQDIVIICLNHSPELVAAFWGILYAGAIPIISHYPEHVPNHNKFKEQICGLVKNSGARGLITLPELRSELGDALRDLNCQAISATEILTRPGKLNLSVPKDYALGEQIAYIQYTSGSAGRQKGVMLSHRAILNFIQSYATALDLRPQDVIVNWPPLYHDLGLFSGIVLSLTTGVPLVLMSPFKWVHNPKALLEAIQRHGGTHCIFPNFGLNHTLRSVKDQNLNELDLSTLRFVGLGGEPIHYDSINNFFGFFKSFGLAATAIKPGYGMAENTLAATVTKMQDEVSIDWVNVRTLYDERRAGPADLNQKWSIPVVSCGLPLDGVDVGIVDSSRNRLPERSVGEIAIRTEFLFSGYHLNPELTGEVMEDGWYYTGDIGYVAKGHLYVCGRKKDLIIKGGQNIHPEDLETVANSVSGIKPGRAVAFGIDDPRTGSEKIVMVCELVSGVGQENQANINRELRRRVFHELYVSLSEVRFVESGWIVKTYNGRMVRSANRMKYLKEPA